MYIHIRTYIYVHTYTYIHIRTYIYVHTYTYIHICTYIYVHTYMYIHIRTFILTIVGVNGGRTCLPLLWTSCGVGSILLWKKYTASSVLIQIVKSGRMSTEWIALWKMKRSSETLPTCFKATEQPKKWNKSLE